MVSGKTLRLVRHAMPLVDPGTCYGALDVRADPAGTQAAASALAPHLPPGILVHCSPLQRCVQLAQALRLLRTDIEIRLDSRLAEMDFGTWEGRRWDAIGQAALDVWTADFANHRPGGGEPVSGFIQRVSEAFGDARKSGGDATWITHAGVMRAARLISEGAHLTNAADWPMDAPAFGACTMLPLSDPASH